MDVVAHLHACGLVSVCYQLAPACVSNVKDRPGLRAIATTPKHAG